MTQTVETPEGPVPATLRVGTGEAAIIVGLNQRTIERYVDAHRVRGGRPTSPVTRQPIPRSHRWVHAGDVVALAVDRGLADQIPAQWRHLIPQQPSAAT